MLPHKAQFANYCRTKKLLLVEESEPPADYGGKPFKPTDPLQTYTVPIAQIDIRYLWSTPMLRKAAVSPLTYNHGLGAYARADPHDTSRQRSVGCEL